jgi:hypothetical protein
MALVDQIMAIYPTLTTLDFDPRGGTILLQNDTGVQKDDYIASWTNSNPQPTQEELNATGK